MEFADFSGIEFSGMSRFIPTVLPTSRLLTRKCCLVIINDFYVGLFLILTIVYSGCYSDYIFCNKVSCAVLCLLLS